MTRNQFLIVTGLCGLVFVLLILQIVFVRMANYDQARLVQAQQMIQQGQVSLSNLQKLAVRTAQVSQQSGDDGLKQLMARQQITISPNAQQAPADGSTAPATR